MQIRTKSRGAHGRRLLVLGILLVIPGAKNYAREKRTLQKSQTDLQIKAANTSLDQFAPVATNWNSSTLRVQSSLAGGNQRALVQFDLSTLPNVGIKSAILSLQVKTPSALMRTYNAHFVTGFSWGNDASWRSSTSSKLWASPGGDFSGRATARALMSPLAVSASWDITRDVQAWYSGTPNFGILIKDSVEGDAAGIFTTFASNEDPVPANRPRLDVTYVQNVQNLNVAPSYGGLTLNWTYPLPLGTILEPNVGVLILRRAGSPVDPSSVPMDGTIPELCSSIGTATVVFNDSANATHFADNFGDSCGAPANGVAWFYKVFLRDSANNYSANGVHDGAFVPEISATPDGVLFQRPVWMAATGSAAPSASRLSPADVSAITVAQSALLLSVDSHSGLQPYSPVSLGAPITTRSSIVDKTDSSTARDVIYAADQSGLLYALNTRNGNFIWFTDPNGGAESSIYGAAAVLVKEFSSPSYIHSTDLLVLGTRNPGTRTGNQVLGINANTGTIVWQITGNTGVIPALDMISSAPVIDYRRNAIWLTTRSAGTTEQPSLWEIDANTGNVLTTSKLGDIDDSPALTPQGEELFVGNNAGTLFAINPANGETLTSFEGGDGAIRGAPVVVNSYSPYQIVFSSSSKVQKVSFDARTNTFTPIWNTDIASPSTPLHLVGLSKIYVGSSDGKIHEMDVVTGSDGKQRSVNQTKPTVVGDPSVDAPLSRIYVCTTDQRMYAFAIPF
jgi:outer membrane protein assembly factor BamB